MSASANQVWPEFDVHVTDDRPGISFISLCGLCGNSGAINTLQTATDARGRPCGIRGYCICPNGRNRKKRDGLPKWGGDSVVTTTAHSHGKRPK